MADKPYDDVTLAAADAFWLEPESAAEAVERLEALGYKIVKVEAE